MLVFQELYHISTENGKKNTLETSPEGVKRILEGRANKARKMQQVPTAFFGLIRFNWQSGQSDQ